MAAFTHPAESRFRGGDYGVFYCAAMGLTAIRETVHPNFSELAMVMDDLCKQVTAARQEFDMAVTFHETWKPAAYDQGLHSRMGPSYASQTFLVIRTALRREMVLALMRLWDKSRGSVRVWRIAENLRNPSVIDALARDRAERIGLSEAVDAMRADLGEKAAEAIRLTDKYRKVARTLRSWKNFKACAAIDWRIGGSNRPQSQERTPPMMRSRHSTKTAPNSFIN